MILKMLYLQVNVINSNLSKYMLLNFSHKSQLIIGVNEHCHHDHYLYQPPHAATVVTHASRGTVLMYPLWITCNAYVMQYTPFRIQADE